MKLTVKNWKEFQHYKDRCPPWIKLHHRILDDFEFHSLPVASRALAPCIWLIASEELDGIVDADYSKLAFRLRQTAKQIEDALTPLIQKGFLIEVRRASDAIAEREQLAVPETETETEKRGAAALPDWVPRINWDGWIAARKKKPTPRAIALAIAKLDEFRGRGIDICAVLDASTMGGWTDLYEPKDTPKFERLQVL